MRENTGFVNKIMEIVKTSEISKNTQFISTKSNKVTEDAYRAAEKFTREIKNEYMGRNFYFFFDPDEKIKFVLDQGNAQDNKLYEKALKMVNKEKIIIHTPDSLSQAFGFKNNLDRLMKSMSISDRKKYKEHKKFNTENFLHPSSDLIVYRPHAEYANFMFYQFVTSELWGMNPETVGLSREDIQIEPQLVEAIYDFCKLDHIEAETKDWLEDYTLNRYTNKEQRRQLTDIRKKNREEAVYRIGYLKSLDMIFQEFVMFSDQFKINKKVLSLEESISSLSSLSMEMEAERDTLVQKVMDLSIQGQALSAQTMALNQSLEDVLQSVEGISPRGNGIIEK